MVARLEISVAFVCLCVCLSVFPHDYFNKKLCYCRRTARRACYVSKFVLFHDVWKLERFYIVKVTFRGIQEHRQWCHSIGHVLFPISVPQNLITLALAILEIWLVPTKILMVHVT